MKACSIGLTLHYVVEPDEDDDGYGDDFEDYDDDFDFEEDEDDASVALSRRSSSSSNVPKLAFSVQKEDSEMKQIRKSMEMENNQAISRQHNRWVVGGGVMSSNSSNSSCRLCVLYHNILITPCVFCRLATQYITAFLSIATLLPSFFFSPKHSHDFSPPIERPALPLPLPDTRMPNKPLLSTHVPTPGMIKTVTLPPSTMSSVSQRQVKLASSTRV